MYISIRITGINYTHARGEKVLDKENLSNNQEFLLLVIISSIIMTLMCDSGVIL